MPPIVLQKVLCEFVHSSGFNYQLSENEIQNNLYNKTKKLTKKSLNRSNNKYKMHFKEIRKCTKTYQKIYTCLPIKKTRKLENKNKLPKPSIYVKDLILYSFSDMYFCSVSNHYKKIINRKLRNTPANKKKTKPRTIRRRNRDYGTTRVVEERLKRIWKIDILLLWKTRKVHLNAPAIIAQHYNFISE